MCKTEQRLSLSNRLQVETRDMQHKEVNIDTIRGSSCKRTLSEKCDVQQNPLCVPTPESHQGRGDPLTPNHLFSSSSKNQRLDMDDIASPKASMTWNVS